MNIKKINMINFMPLHSDNNTSPIQTQQSYGLRMTMPLTQDTVCFQAKKGRKSLQAAKAIAKAAKQKAEALMEDTGAITNKTLTDESRKSWKLNMDLATRIHRDALKRQEYIHDFVTSLYGDLVAIEKRPNNPIICLRDRAKEPYSIAQKAASRQLKTEEEILDTMTDLNGYKVVMNKKMTQADTDSALDRLIPMITTGQVEISEIEVKLPGAIKGLPVREQAKYYVASKSKLQKLVEIQESVWNGPNTAPENIRKVKFGKPQYTPANYCAVHFLMDLPNKPVSVFEGQYMRVYSGERKDLDDILFKLLDGKEVSKKYNPIANLIKALKEDTTGALDRFKQYRKDANFALVQQEIKDGETQTVSRKESQLYISARKYNLPPEYDMNYLWELKLSCDKKAEIASKNLEGARKIKQAKAEAQHNSKSNQKAPQSKVSIKRLIQDFGPKTPKSNENQKSSIYYML